MTRTLLMLAGSAGILLIFLGFVALASGKPQPEGYYTHERYE